MKENNKLEQYIIEKIKRDYDYWQGYANEVEDRIKEIEEKKKEIVENLKKDPENQLSQDMVLYLSYDYNNYMQDLRKMITKLSEIYKIADDNGLTDNFNDSLNNKMQKILSEDSGPIFVYENGRLVERVKGEREEIFNTIKNEYYDKMIDTIVDLLEQ